MLSGFEKKVAKYIDANELLGSARKLLLAVSGGADSIALLYSLHNLKTAGALNCEFVCAHVNHQLRASEADRDEEYVAACADELRVPVITRRADVRRYAWRNKLSVETAARQLRIRILSEIARANDCDAIVTAHQKNDNAETVLQRLARGTGYRGLAGIWPQRVFADGAKFVRPFLCIRRDEILEYLRSRSLRWRDDRTNADVAHRRNYIRHRLLPVLQQSCTHSLVDQLSELAESARGFYRLVATRVDELWPQLADCAGEQIALRVGTLSGQPSPVKIELVRRCLEYVGCGERYVTQRHYESILQLVRQNVTGRRIQLPEGFVAVREYGRIIFGPDGECSAGLAPSYGDECVSLNVPGRTEYAGCAVEATIVDAEKAGLEQFLADKTALVERFDLAGISLPLIVRRRRPGDRFVPLGQTAEKKVGKFLTAQRIPRRVREQVLVVADSERVVWICPVRISELTKVTGRTRSILQLRIVGIEDRQNSVDAAAPGQ